MVSSREHIRRRSSGSGSVSGRSERDATSTSRRRSSVRRQSERNLGATSQSSSSVRNLRIRQQQKRAHSLASGSLQPPLSSSDNFRRPSAPARQTMAGDTPQLSIAERFMSSKGASSVDLLDEDFDTRSKSSMSTAATLSSPQATARAPDPGRLTIADAFMKSRSSSVSSSSENRLDSTTDHQNETRNTKSSVEHVHPLELGNSRSTGALDSNFHLDLTLPVPPSSNERRPFGSQETLVQPMSATEKATIRSVDENGKKSDAFSLNDYYNYSYEDEDCGSSTTQQGDDETMNDKYKKQHDANHRWRNLSAEESAANVDDSERAKGVWIGCCFVSCGRRPGNKAMLEEQKRHLRQKQDPRRCGHPGWVFLIFLVFIGIVVAAYVLWPRTPLMRIEGASLVSPAHITETRQGVMVGNVAFESQWLVNVTVDNRENPVPTRLVRVEVLAKDALTGLTIGKGLHNNDQTDASGLVLPPGAISPIQLPVVIDYQARDSSDTTFSNLKSACTSQPPVTIHDSKTNRTITQQPEREALQVHFWITIYIWGLEWFGYKPTVIATPATGGFACPLSS